MIRHLALIASLVTCGAAAASAAVENDRVVPHHGPGLSLRIPDESAPAGSTVQLKVEVTEPKPISTGRGKIKPRGIATVQGIVLMNEGQDTFGVALVDEDGVSFSITSPTGVFGTPADYPILGIAGTVAPNASRGTTFPVTLENGGLEFRDPSGAVYPYEIENGQLTVDNDVVTIGDVQPGSAVVPAGGVVRILGANFRPDTRIRVGEANIVEQRYMSSGRIDVVLGQATRMHGVRIRARNDEGDSDERSESEYFSYERTAPLGASSDPVLSKAVPLFAPATYTSATVDLQRRSAGRRRSVRPAFGAPATDTGTTFGIALQNLEQSAATVTVELLDGAGNPYAVNSVTVDPDRYFVRALGEVFGIVPPPAAFRIRSSTPIYVLGLATDPSAGTARALPPR